MGKLFSAYRESLYLENAQNLEMYKYIEDLLLTEEVLSLKNFNQHYDINRLQHVMSVANVAFVMCEKFGLDSNSAVRGAILHDLFYYDWQAKATVQSCLKRFAEQTKLLHLEIILMT